MSQGRTTDQGKVYRDTGFYRHDCCMQSNVVDSDGVRCRIKRHDFFPDPHKGDQMTFLDCRSEQTVLF